MEPVTEGSLPNSSLNFSNIKNMDDYADDREQVIARSRKKIIESQISKDLNDLVGTLNEREIKAIFDDHIEEGTSAGKRVRCYQDLNPDIRKLFLKGKENDSDNG